jgi:molecular chaperone DnaK
MVNEAKRNEAEDRKRKELVEARNHADSLAYTAEKALRDLGDKVPGDDRKNIEKKIADLRTAIKGDDVARIRALTEEVQQASYALSQQTAQRAGAGASGRSGGASGPGGRDEGEVVEGEFREA